MSVSYFLPTNNRESIILEEYFKASSLSAEDAPVHAVLSGRSAT